MQPTSPSQAPDRKVYQVSEITREIKFALENQFGRVWIRGELSNVRRQASGHVYFTLKDDRAQISAALFRGNQRGIPFEPKDGLSVRVYGEVTVYEPRGQYQLIVRTMEEAGVGSLQEAFEKLKKRLAGEGLFDPERKAPIPVLPQHVGVVTSPTGAAVRDILNVVHRRFPNLHVVLAPVKVQGEGAANEIAAAVDLFNEWGGVDVLIVGRGGGSLEDLWAFNEEVVARAVARSRIPVVSAVGHEIDFTICDFVADLRAATPSAAAELVVGRKEAYERNLRELARRLARLLQARTLEARNRLTAAAKSYVFHEPQNIIRHQRQRLDAFATTLQHRLRGKLQQHQQRTDELNLRLAHRAEAACAQRKQDLRRLSSQLAALSPTAILNRGYSITWSADGRLVRSYRDAQAGDQLETMVADGRIQSEVKATTPGDDDAGEAS